MRRTQGYGNGDTSGWLGSAAALRTLCLRGMPIKLQQTLDKSRDKSMTRVLRGKFCACLLPESPRTVAHASVVRAASQLCPVLAQVAVAALGRRLVAKKFADGRNLQ